MTKKKSAMEQSLKQKGVKSFYGETNKLHNDKNMKKLVNQLKDSDDLLQKIMNIYVPNDVVVSSNIELKIRITYLLGNLGIPASIKGFRYLRSAILYAIEDIQYMDAITKTLYPAVAKEYNTTPPRVERAIRHAIEVSCDRGDIELLHNILSYSIDSKKGKPTNSEFIGMIAEKFRLGIF